MHVDDLANAIYKILKLPQIKIRKIIKSEYPLINVGSGESISIKNLAKMIKKILRLKIK